ncbi:Cysteine-rich receptor-like protein kinase 26 [Vitis vinifera]|uniref:Cysteine-rich receptor-like protein kinase 26 n=1 Tax=Vitis vinifera TaxID=29760 RepID=A0A438HRX0_VITVI|nr:Cysteine-rich receptor-like protein kinase 26 [Vitis vinifera]
MESPRLLFFLYPILILHLLAVTNAQPKFLYYRCSNGVGNYTNNSTYKANLNTLLTSLSSNNEIDYGFYNFSAGQNSDKVNAIALCRGDVMQPHAGVVSMTLGFNSLGSVPTRRRQ